MASRFALLPLALVVAGCSAPNSGQPGPFAGPGAAAAAASQITRSGNSTSAETRATGAPLDAMQRETNFVIEKHQASAVQRAIAIKRIRAIVARRHAGKKLPRYLAVETIRDKHTNRGALHAIMLWDTETQDVVGNNVYDIGNAPAAGSTSHFETYSAEYVGAGL